MGLKVLGQVKPSASANTRLFVAEADCVISTLYVCNQNASEDNFRVSVCPQNITPTSATVIYYDVAIPGKTTFTSTTGITLSKGDSVYVYSKNAYSSFSAFGQYVL